VSGEGSPPLRVRSAAGLRVGVVAATWHKEIADALLEGARRALAD
jgi:6,7-dimethyl-8-ribityllumazine synthase